jgi:hypothetical protein
MPAQQLSGRALWTMLLILCPLVGFSFFQAVALYGEASSAARDSAALASGLSPLDGVLVPSFGAFYLAVTLLFPFVAICTLGREKDSGLITVHLAPEDPRYVDLRRNVLAKLERAVPNVSVRLASTGQSVVGSTSDEAYGEIESSRRLAHVSFEVRASPRRRRRLSNHGRQTKNNADDAAGEEKDQPDGVVSLNLVVSKEAANLAVPRQREPESQAECDKKDCPNEEMKSFGHDAPLHQPVRVGEVRPVVSAAGRDAAD